MYYLFFKYLLKFKFQIKYIKGKENIIINIVSRRLDYIISLKQLKTNILKEDKDRIYYNNKVVFITIIIINKIRFYQ